VSAVVHLIPNNALAVNQEQLADCMRRFADRLEAGEFGEIERLCIILDGGDTTDYQCYGRQCNKAELVGVLEYAKARIMQGED